MSSSGLLLVVREVDPALRAETDGLVHPIPAGRQDEVVLEPADGEAISTVPAKGLAVRMGSEKHLRTIASVEDVAIRVTITDSRVVVACSRFDKGGGWIGGAAFMVLANTISKSLAASGRRGKMLVGHARYEWLYAVGASPKSGPLDTESVRLCMHTESGEALVLDVYLPSDLAASQVAAEVIRRVAAHRLASGVAPEHGADFDALRQVRPSAGVNDWDGFHVIPASLPFGKSPALLGSADGQ
jgi:hypothetical protein